MAKLIQYSLCVPGVLMFCFLLNQVQAQNSCRLVVHPVDGSNTSIEALNLQNNFKDKTSCIQYINHLPQLLALKGYAAASVDSVWEDSTAVYINLFTGNKYRWQKL